MGKDVTKFVEKFVSIAHQLYGATYQFYLEWKVMSYELLSRFTYIENQKYEQ